MGPIGWVCHPNSNRLHAVSAIHLLKSAVPCDREYQVHEELLAGMFNIYGHITMRAPYPVRYAKLTPVVGMFLWNTN
jgi:hypothetical protein